MRIALDAMGSDECPVPDVAGAVLAAREYRDTTIVLVGDEARIKAELSKHDTTGLLLEVVHAEQAITMTDKPSAVGESKPNSSMHVGMRLVKEGKADAFATAGNTGAAYAIALLYVMKRISGVKRPALTTLIPTLKQPVVLLDAGANADAKADWLAQFALMGNIYAKNALGLSTPRVGLLSNGEEEGKGSELVRETAELLRALPLNYIGNIEPRDLLHGEADVVVADGFSGNIFIKSAEAATEVLISFIRDGIKSSVLSSIGGLLIRPALRGVRRKIDPNEIGGAPLLGVNGVVIIGHGRSNSIGIKNAIRQARLTVTGGVVDAIRDGLAKVPQHEQS